jgi:hypothetical protein
MAKAIGLVAIWTAVAVVSIACPPLVLITFPCGCFATLVVMA